VEEGQDEESNRIVKVHMKKEAVILIVVQNIRNVFYI